MVDLTIFGDIHIAKRWDEIGKQLPKRIHFQNPNKIFSRELARLKKSTTLIINGDLVDYYHDIKDKSTNWDYFFKIFNCFKGKYFFNLGNHEYRSEPYNFNLYGLWNVGVKKEDREKYLKEFFHFRYFKELKSVLVNLGKFNPLRKYPFPKFYVEDMPDNKLIFLNTGFDAKVNFKRFTQFIFFIKSWTNLKPNSTGLSRKCFNFFKKELKSSKKDVIIFVHCPAFFSLEKIKSFKIKKYNYLFRLFNHTFHEGFIRNNWNFVKALRDSKKNIIVVSSHTHEKSEYLIDKKKNILRDSTIKEISKLKDNQDFVKFITIPSLTEIDMDVKKKQRGFLKITDKDIHYKFLK